MLSFRIMNDNPQNDPESPDMSNIIKFLGDGLQIRQAVTIQVHQEILCNLLAKEPSILQGKEPADYIDSRVQEKLNLILAGAADISPSAASALARLLMPKKPPPHA